MAIVTTDNRHYQNIAHAIRDAAAYEGPIPPAQMAGLITGVGQAANEAGRKEEYDFFWTNAMESNSFAYRFAGSCWNDATFKPAQDICPTGNAYNLFYLSDIE